MKLSEMRQLLTEHDIQLTKSLGQNFLHDGNQLRRIVGAAELCAEDDVLEIGPGLGPLTELLLPLARHVTAIEKDGRLVELLRKRFASAANFQLIEADALDLFKTRKIDWTKAKLVANLPYSVASPILVELAQPARCPSLMVVTLQLEVARRIMAQPGTSDFGLLTLLLQVHYEPDGMFKIPASCFFPAPDVASACIVLRRRATPLLGPDECNVFVRLVKLAFSQRRKMMAKLLRAEWPDELIRKAMETVTIPANSRAEQVSLHQFTQLTKALT